jgi:hypothetical protein
VNLTVSELRVEVWPGPDVMLRTGARFTWKNPGNFLDTSVSGRLGSLSRSVIELELDPSDSLRAEVQAYTERCARLGGVPYPFTATNEGLSGNGGRVALDGAEITREIVTGRLVIVS